MGVAISDWNLARSVSMQGSLGVVSGTGIALVLANRLMDGDIGGHVRRALDHFPYQDSVQRILDKYFVSDPKSPKAPYKRPPMWTFKPSKSLMELTVVANFVEVFLAKEGHKNPVGINLLEKVQMPNISSLYGAMLAGVNFVIMGAGIPLEIPGVLDGLAEHKKVSYRIDVQGGEDKDLSFDPQEIFTNVAKKIGDLSRPLFLPIISSVVLAKTLIKRSTGKVDGFVIEGPIAGGHNAPPRGQLQLNEKNEPIYGERDEVDLEKMKELGLPFWLAGGYDSPEMLQQALDAGAAGIQVGTAFALCEESGMRDSLKKQIIQQAFDEDINVLTDARISPTGFPFKVVQLEGTMSELKVYQERPRLCDIGLLRNAAQTEDGKVIFRCASEPEDQFLKKGGKPEDLIGRGCLCNNLFATAGQPQHRKDGYVEMPVVTSGDGLTNILRFFKPGQRSYTSKDVIDYLKGEPR